MSDAFGDGIDDEEVEVKKPRRRRIGTARTKASAADTDGSDDSEESPKPRRTRRTTTRTRAAKKTDADAADSEANSDGESSSRRPVGRGRSRRNVAREEADYDGESQADFLDEAFDHDEEPVREASGSASSADDSDDGGRDGDGNRDSDGGRDGDGRPRRRRRRRRRGGDNGDRPQMDRGGSGRGGQRNNGRGGRGNRGGRNRRDTTRPGRRIQANSEPIEGTFEGVLELHPTKGYGFLRDPRRNYAAEDNNPFVPANMVQSLGLREGVLVRGEVGAGSRNQGPRLMEVELIDGFTPEEYAEVRHFDELTPINPFEQIRLETGPRPLTMRVMDLLCPIGKGQRALLVAPPRTGKTMLLQDIANAVSINHPEIHLMVLLIDERPEEVTEMQRMVNGEVVSSSLDHDVDSHVRIAQLIIERGKRLAEEGKDVFILLDSITRLARAFNKRSNTGRTQTGGLDIRALDIPKKLFGTARRFDEGGSLTVCGTALIDTGSRMDEAIFQEFKGTGNMEMVLSRELADRRIWPSIDVSKSGTRREEKILSPEVLEGTTLIRRSLISLGPIEAMEHLTRLMEKFKDNKEFLTKIRAVL